MKTILVDFDGVIHRYSRGWDDGTAYDPPMEGALDAVLALQQRYEVVVFSTRGVADIALWLDEHGFPDLRITNEKLPAIAIIDDRAVRFTDWSSALAEVAERYG